MAFCDVRSLSGVVIYRHLLCRGIYPSVVMEEMARECPQSLRGQSGRHDPECRLSYWLIIAFLIGVVTSYKTD